MLRLLLASMTSLIGFTAIAAEPKLELVVQTGHSCGVMSTSLSDDGQWLATGGGDFTCILWNVATGRKVRAFVADQPGRGVCNPASISMSGDGSKLALSIGDPYITLRRTNDGATIRDFKVESAISVSSVTLSRDGSKLLGCVHTNFGKAPNFSPATAVYLWKAEDGSLIRKFETGTGYVKATMSRDGRRVLSTSEDGSAKVWDAESGQTLQTLRLREKRISDLTISDDGTTAVTLSEGNVVTSWNVATGEVLRTYESVGVVNHVAISGNGERVLASAHNLFTVWNATTGQKIRTDTVGTIAIDRDGRCLIGSEGFGNTQLLNAETGAVLQSFRGDTEYSSSATFLGDGKSIRTSSTELWDLATGVRKTATPPRGDANSSTSFSTSEKVAVTWAGKVATLWQNEPRKKLHDFPDTADAINYAALNDDGSRMLVLDGRKTITVWETATRQKIETYSGSWANLSPDGRRVAIHTDDAYEVWDIARRVRVYSAVRVLTDAHNAHRFNGDASMVVHVTPEAIELFDLAKQQTTARLPWVTRFSRSMMNDLVEVPDRRHAIVAGVEARLWNLATMKSVSLVGHTSVITSAELNRDATKVLTGSQDGTVRLWDAATGKELCALISVESGKDWLVVTPDGYFDASPNGAKYISYRIAGTNEMVPLERYRKQFERPGLLAKIWKGEDYRGNSVVNRDVPPSVRITSPAAKFEAKSGKLTITAEAESRGEYPVTRFRLKINGKPHGVQEGLVTLDAPKLGKATASWNIDIEPGRHTLEVLAYTDAVFNVSDAVEVSYLGGAARVELPNLYVLAVGISQYPAKADQLDFAHRDAEELAQAFQESSKTLFKKIEVKTLTNEKATRGAVLDELLWLRRSMTQRDFGVFFYAGHGVMDERGKFYLFPVDGNRERLSSSALEGNTLQDEIVSTPGQLLVLLDACHSGSIGNKTRDLTENLLKDLSSEEKGVAVMSSAKGRELAQESREHKHGLFTLALVEGLRGRGSSKLPVRLTDGAVYFKQLDSYVTERVKELSQGQQHPLTSMPRRFQDYPVSKP